MPPLRVSIVEPSGQLYGSELCLLEILEGLDAVAFEVEVLLPHGAPFRQRLELSGIACRELLWGGAWTAPRWRKLPGYLRLWSRWRRARPDLIYVNQGGILRPVAAIARRLHIPILCQVQTLEDARWVSGLESCHASVAAFVCNSQFIAAQCRVPKDRLSTVYYGYKPKGLGRKRRKSRDLPARFEVGLLGRICESKGHYLVVEAARRMKAAGLAPIHFRFVGAAPTAEELAKVRGLVEDGGLRDWIEFRGYQTNLAEEFAALDLLVIPSQAEPFGRILCEAAEAEVPVLLADAGGGGELSRRFDVGLRFKAGDVTEFVDQLQHVRHDYDKVRVDFAADAARLLAALPMHTYLGVIEKLMMKSAACQPSAECWLGDSAEPVSQYPVEVGT